MRIEDQSARLPVGDPYILFVWIVFIIIMISPLPPMHSHIICCVPEKSGSLPTKYASFFPSIFFFLSSFRFIFIFKDGDDPSKAGRALSAASFGIDYVMKWTSGWK